MPNFTTPTAAPDTLDVNEDDALANGSVAGNDGTPDDGDTWTFSLDDPAPAGLTFHPDGSYSFDPSDAAYQHLADSAQDVIVLHYTVTNSEGATSSTTFTITVTGVNDAPTAGNDTANATEDGTPATGTVATNDSDVDDGATLSYALNGTVAGLTIDPDGSYSFDPSDAAYQHLADGATTDVVATYTVTDDKGATDTATLTIHVTGVNDAPTAGNDTANATEDGTPATGTVATNDSDVDDGATLSYALNGTVAGLTIDPDGSYSFDPSDAAYQHLADGATTDVVATYTVTDDKGATDTATLTIHVTGVNDAPTAGNDTANATEDGTPATGTVATNDSDVDDGATLSYALNGTVAGLTIDPDGSYSFDPSDAAYQHLADGATTDVVATYTVTDDKGATDTATLTIHVTGVNDAPVATGETIAVDEDATAQAADRSGGLLANDTDVDTGETETLRVSGAHFGTDPDTAVPGDTTPVAIAGTYGTLHVASDGTYSYTPDSAAAEALVQGASASDAFSYTVSDVHGATSVATVTFNITGTNDAASIGVVSGGDYAVTEAGGTANATAGDPNASGQLTISDVDTGEGHFVTPSSLAGTYGTFTFNTTNGEWTYALDQGLADPLTAGQSATDTLTVHSDDGTAHDIVVNITGSNDDASIGVVSGGDYDATEAGGTANAAAGDPNASGQLTISDVDSGEAHFQTPASLSGLYGTFTFNTTSGAWTYALDQGRSDPLTVGQSVTDTLTVTSADGTATHDIVVNITGSNDAPVATGDMIAVDEDATAQAGTRSGGLLANDSDPDTGETATLTVSGAHFGAASDTAVPSDTTPVAIVGTYGTLNIASDGTYSYTPDSGAAEALPQGVHGSDVFSYTVSDVHGATSTTTVTFDVTGQNDAPGAGQDFLAVDEDATASAASRDGGLLANDTDTDTGEAATLTVTAAHFGDATDTAVPANNTPVAIAGAYGTLNLAADGTYSYTPNNAAAEALAQGVHGIDVLIYTIADAQGATSTTSVLFDITGQNDAPVATGETIAVDEDATAQAATRSGGLLANDTDVDNGETNALRVSGAHFGTDPDTADPGNNTPFAIAGTYGTLNIASDGTYSYTPDSAAAEALVQGASASDAFSYTVSDVHGATSVATVTFNITGTNDAASIGVVSGGDYAVTEAGGTANATAGDPNASGQLTISDVDTGEGHFVTPSSLAGTYGTFTFNTTNGEWTYALDQGLADPLTAGQSATDTLTVHSDDGTAHDIVVNITGSNDDASIGVVSGGDYDVTEAGGTANAAAGDPDASGRLTISDVDTGEDHFATPSSLAGTYGTFAFNATTGAWTYALNQGRADPLTVGQSVTDTLTVTSADGTATHDIVVNITGSNDAPLAGNVTLPGGQDVANAGFDLSPDFAGWAVDSSVHGASGSTTALVDRSGEFAGDDAVAILTLLTHMNSVNSVAFGPSLTSTAFEGVAGDVVRIVYRQIPEQNGALAHAYLIDATTHDVVQTIFDSGPTFTDTGVQTVDVPLASSGSFEILIQDGVTVVDPNSDDFAFLEIGFAGLINTHNEDHAFTYADGKSLLLANASDVDAGDTPDVAPFTATSAMGATVTLAADGSLTIDPTSAAALQALAAGTSATDSVTFTVTDSHGAQTSATAFFIINGVNDAPVAGADVNGTDLVTEAGVHPGNTPFAGDDSAAGNVLTNDSDVDTGDTRTVSAVEGDSGKVGNAVAGTYGSVTIHGDGSYTYTLDNNDPDTQALAQGATATDVFHYTVSDAYGGTATTTLTITITGTNDAPVLAGLDDVTFVEDNPGTPGLSPIHLDLGADATVTDDSADLAGGTLTLSITSGGVAAEDVLTVDGSGASLSGGNVMVGTTMIGTYAGGTGGNPFVVTFNANATPDLVQDLVRALVYDNSSQEPTSGDRSYTLVITDGDGGTSNTESHHVSVFATNDAPSGTDATLTATEDTVYHFATADFGFTDIDGDNLLAVEITTLPSHGTMLLNGVAVQAGDFVAATEIAAGHLTFQAAADANGTGYASFTFQVQDDGGTDNGSGAPNSGIDTDQSANTITFDVTAVNDAPVNHVPAGQAVDEDTGLTFSAALSNAITVSDVDAGGGDVTVTLSVAHGVLQSFTGVGVVAHGDGTDTLDITGTVAAVNAALDGLVYTPDANYNGSDSIHIVTTDNGHSGSGGPLTDTSNVAINLGAVNDAPTIVGGTASLPAIDEDLPSNVGYSVSSVLASHFSDAADAQASAGNPMGSSADTFLGIAITGNGSSAGTGQWQYYDGANWVDVGAVSASSALLLNAGTMIRFNPAQDFNTSAAPVPALDVHLIESGYGVFADGDSADLSTGGTTGGASHVSAGTVAISETINAVNDGPTAAITPPGGGFQTDEQIALDLKHTISVGDVDSGSGTVTVTLSTDYGLIHVTAGTSGVTSITGDNSASVTITGTIGAIQALLDSDASSVVQYTPNTNTPPASATISLAIDDGGNSGTGGPLSADASASVSIFPVNDAPAGIDHGLPVTIGTPRVLGPSVFTFTDAESNGLLSVTINTLPTAGTIVFDADGPGGNPPVPIQAGDTFTALQVNGARLLYVPGPGASGSNYDSFTYSVRDNGGTLHGGLDTDASPNTITVNINTTNSAPTEMGLSGDNAVYTEDGAPVPLDVGHDAVISDFDSADFDGGTLNVSIIVNHHADQDLLDFDQSGSVQIVGADVDVDGTTIGTLTAAGGSGNIAITFNALATPDLVTTLIHALTYANSDTVSPSTDQRIVEYRLTDGDGGTLFVDSTIEVRGVNDAPTLGATGLTPTFTEGDAAVVLFQDAAGGTIESDQSFDRLVFTVSNVSGGANERIHLDGSTIALTDGASLTSADHGLAVTVTVSGGTATVTVDGALAPGAFSTLIDSLAYEHAGDNPMAGDRVITLTSARDDGGTDNGGIDTVDLAISATVTVVPVDDAPVVQPDAVQTDEATLLHGSVFADNGSGADVDPDSPLSVAAVNGSSANVGAPIVLASGARLTLNADGSFDYNPNHAFDATPTGGSGASNTPAHDSFTYTLLNGGTATVSVTIAGLDSNDLLLGTAGNDSLAGGVGNDAYIVSQPGDVVTELVGQGNDTIYTTVSYALAAGSEVETLTAYDRTTTNPLVLTGNGFANVIYGNNGSDALIGGAGADTMYGLGGDDSFIVDNSGDQVIEFAGQGNDTVYTTVSYTLTAGSEIETLTVYDRATTNGLVLTGNSFANTIIGNNGADALIGGAGADTMYGLGGDDSYIVDNAGDRVIEGAGQGNDTVYTTLSYTLTAGSEIETLTPYDRTATNALVLTGNASDNTIFGNNGADALIGGGGNDTMYGLAGDDGYIVDSAGDQAIEFAGQGNDTVYTSVSYALTAGSSIETLTAYDRTATNALVLTGNALDNVIFGNNGADALIGGGGNDTMYGLGGDDAYIVDSAGDQAIEFAGQGNDTVYTSVSYTLTAGSEIETLTVYDRTSTNALVLTGNGFDNVIFGNNGGDALIGGGGNDTMYGLGGDDAYIVDSASDRVIEFAGQGNDTVYTSVSYALTAGSEIETLTVYDRATTNALVLAGNEFDNVIIGNNGSDALIGGGGNDIMYGLGGDDAYIVDSASDQAIEGVGQGNDTVYTSVSYTLTAGSEIETLTAYDRTTTNALNLTGNDLANSIIGNNGADIIDGKGGNDILYGLGGADTFLFDTAPGAGNVDMIADFTHGVDVISLDHAVFSALAAGAVGSGVFGVGAAATQEDQRIVYNQATGALYYDADGNGAGAAVQFASVAPGTMLTASDFHVI